MPVIWVVFCVTAALATLTYTTVCYMNFISYSGNPLFPYHTQDLSIIQIQKASSLITPYLVCSLCMSALMILKIPLTLKLRRQAQFLNFNFVYVWKFANFLRIKRTSKRKSLLKKQVKKRSREGLQSLLNWTLLNRISEECRSFKDKRKEVGEKIPTRILDTQVVP